MHRVARWPASAAAASPPHLGPVADGPGSSKCKPPQGRHSVGEARRGVKLRRFAAESAGKVASEMICALVASPMGDGLLPLGLRLIAAAVGFYLDE